MPASRLSVRGWGEGRGSPFDARPPARHISPRYRFRGFLTSWRMNRGLFYGPFWRFRWKKSISQESFFILIWNMFSLFSDPQFVPTGEIKWKLRFFINRCKINTFYTLNCKRIRWTWPFFIYLFTSIYLFFIIYLLMKKTSLWK